MNTSANAKTWIEIDSQALSSNIKELRSVLKPGVEFCAVIKANAYGHDLETILNLALNEGVSHFAVDSIDEAILVRKRAPEATVFVLGYTVPERLRDVIIFRLVQTVYETGHLEQLAKEAAAQQSKAQVNILWHCIAFFELSQNLA